MSVPVDQLAAGQVLCTRDRGWASRMIRLGAALRDQPNLDNHIIVVHHRDAAGTWWGIEGRPGGVGWRALTDKITAAYTLGNAGQPISELQSDQICQRAEKMLGTAYDWAAITTDAANAVGINLDALWHRSGEDGPPAHIVCSAFADYLYESVGLPSPQTHRNYRFTTPADWADFILRRGWEQLR